MEFMKPYNEAIQIAKDKAEKLSQENQVSLLEIEKLNKKYESHVQNLDFESARKVKAQIKEIELEVETKKDMIVILRDSKNQSVIDAAKQAVLAYKDEREKLKKKEADLHKKAMDKREEYLMAVKEILDHNVTLSSGHKQLKRLGEVTNWKSPEVINELGFHASVFMTGDGGIMPLNSYFVRSMEEVRTETNLIDKRLKGRG